MAGFSNYLEQKLLDHSFGGSAFTQPDVFMALFTTSPGEDGTGGTEVSGNAYARVEVTDSFGAASGGSKANDEVITFPEATGNWGTITSFGLYDASTSGNLLAFANLTASKAINTDDTASFPIGDLAITLD
jgi:hypothetical protein